MSGTLLFDGDCGFCTTSAGWAARIDKTAQVVPYQRADLDALGVSEDAAAAALHWVGPNGDVAAAGAAIARFLVGAGGGWRLLGRLMLLPGVRRVADLMYHLIAANRHRLPGGTPACRLD